jgi:hypothetical protein
LISRAKIGFVHKRSRLKTIFFENWKLICCANVCKRKCRPCSMNLKNKMCKASSWYTERKVQLKKSRKKLISNVNFLSCFQLIYFNTSIVRR